VGRHPMQLYSLATPNGVKVKVMLEELLVRGHAGAEYDAWLINIREGDQFGSGFVGVNPNSKIPALIRKCGISEPAAASLKSSLQPKLLQPRQRSPSASVGVAGLDVFSSARLVE